MMVLNLKIFLRLTSLSWSTIVSYLNDDFIIIIDIYLRIDRNFCSVHEEITSIRLYTPCNPMQGCVQPDWGYFEWTEQIISINAYKLIQTFFAMILKNIFICSK
jgi:hypothetical protein